MTQKGRIYWMCLRVQVDVGCITYLKFWYALGIVLIIRTTSILGIVTVDLNVHHQSHSCNSVINYFPLASEWKVGDWELGPNLLNGRTLKFTWHSSLSFLQFYSGSIYSGYKTKMLYRRSVEYGRHFPGMKKQTGANSFYSLVSIYNISVLYLSVVVSFPNECVTSLKCLWFFTQTEGGTCSRTFM